MSLTLATVLGYLGLGLVLALAGIGLYGIFQVPEKEWCTVLLAAHVIAEDQGTCRFPSFRDA